MADTACSGKRRRAPSVDRRTRTDDRTRYMDATTHVPDMGHDHGDHDREGDGHAVSGTWDASTPAGRHLAGCPPELRLRRCREEALAALGQGWRPPAPSQATRAWSLTSRGSGRGTMAIHGDTLGEAESVGELKLLKVTAADPRVATFREQPAGVGYRDGDSKRRHVADVLVETRDGRRIALDYRPERRAAPVRRVTRLLNEQRPSEVDAWLHVGDAKLPREPRPPRGSRPHGAPGRPRRRRPRPWRACVPSSTDP